MLYIGKKTTPPQSKQTNHRVLDFSWDEAFLSWDPTRVQAHCPTLGKKKDMEFILSLIVQGFD